MFKKVPDDSKTYDPDPISIAFTIIGAIAPVGVLIAERAFKHYDDQAMRNELIRNNLYDAYRALNDADRVLKDFGSYIDQQGYLSRPFRMGQAPLQGDGKFVIKVNRLYKDSYVAGRDLNKAMIALSKLLDRKDFRICMAFSDELNNHLLRTVQAENYKDYIVRMSRFIEQAERLIRSLGERYDFQPTQRRFD